MSIGGGKQIPKYTSIVDELLGCKVFKYRKTFSLSTELNAAPYAPLFSHRVCRTFDDRTVLRRLVKRRNPRLHEVGDYDISTENEVQGLKKQINVLEPQVIARLH